MKSNLIDIDVRVHHTTERAIFASPEGDKKKAEWLPLSQVEVIMKRRGVATVTMPEWLAVEKGFA